MEWLPGRDGDLTDRADSAVAQELSDFNQESIGVHHVSDGDLTGRLLAGLKQIGNAL